MKPTIKYLHNGVYQYATVKDIGDIEQLATIVKTDLVSAINSVIGSVPSDYQTVVDDLNTKLDNIASSGMNAQQLSEMETAILNLQTQVALDLSNRINEINLAYDNKFAEITSKYDADVLAINNEITGVKENLSEAESSLTEVGGRLSTAELNVTTVSQKVDTITGELLTKVDNTDFDLLEATVSQQGTAIQQNSNDIVLKANQSSLDLATDRITDAEASIIVNANAIKSTVSKSELKGELEGLDIYAPNIINNSMDWHEWDSTIPAKAYKINDTYQHTIIQEQLGFGGYFDDVVTGLVIGETYTASVWGKSNVSTSKPVFVVNGVSHMMENVNGDGFLGTNWQRFKVSFVAIDSDVIIGFSTTGSVDGNITNFSGGKLEAGSLNTGWRPNEGDANVRVATAESTIIQQADQIAQVVTKQTEVDGTISQQRTEINQMADSIELQATKITDAEGRLSSAESSLNIQSDEIALKVEQTDVDLAISGIKLDSRNHVLNSNFIREFDDWANISNDYEIVSIGGKKYAKISRSGLSSKIISSMSTNKIPTKKGEKLLIGCDIIVDNLSSYDVQKPLTVEFFDIDDVRVDYKEYDLTILGEDVASGVESRLATNVIVDRDDVAKMCVKLTLHKNGSVSYSNISVQKGDIGTGGWTPAPEDSQMIQASLKTEIVQNASAISLKAESSVVDTLSGDLTQLDAGLTVANNAITANVNEMSRINGVVEQHGLDITATAQEMSTKMTSVQVEDLLTGKAYATQSQLTQTSDKIDLRVSKDDVINAINVSTEGIKLDGSKVTITGDTTFNSDVVMNSGKIQSADGGTVLDLNNNTFTFDKPFTIGVSNVATVEDVENIEIGGRNIVPETNRGKVRWGWNRYSGNYSLEDITSLGVNAVKAICTTKSTSWEVLYHTLDLSLISPNTEYTISFDLYPSKSGSVSIETAKDDGTNRLAYFGSQTYTANTWNKIVKTAVTTSAPISDQYIYLTGLFGVDGSSAIIANLKLEKGNKATDWTPAPEDVAYEIEQKADSKAVADAINNVASSAANAQSTANSKLDKSSYDNFINEYIDYKKALASEQSASSKSLQDAKDSITGLTNNMGDMKESWKFNNGTQIDATGDGILLSDDTGGMSLLLSNNRISFFDSDVEVAYIADKTLKINHGIFVKSAQIGAHIISSSPSNPDITIVSWVGI